MPNNSRHTYLLRSLIRCGVCGLTFCGTWARNKPRYSCNGSMVERGPFTGKCIGASIKALSSKTPSGPMSPASSPIPQTSSTSSSMSPTTPRPALSPRPNGHPHRSTLRRSRAPQARHRPLHPRQASPSVEFDAIAAEVEQELQKLDERLADHERRNDALDDAVASEDVLSEIRKRLDGGPNSDAERQEIVQLLVRRITVHTTVPKQRPQTGPHRHRLPLPASSD